MSEPLMLTGLQKEILMKGVVGAYPDPDNLWILLAVRMEVQVSAIARGDAYKNKVFALIQDFEADGRIEEFIRVVVNDKPNSPFLSAIKKEKEFARILGEDSPEGIAHGDSKKENTEGGINRGQLMKNLNQLVPQQFNELTFEINPPPGIIPPSPASQADRVYALLTWAESPSGIGLNRIQGALNAIINPR